MRRLIFFCIAILLASAQRAPAQTARDSTAGDEPSRLCYHARPKPACSAFVLTNFGSYAVFGAVEGGDRTLFRAVADWGLMANVSTRDAIGASAFLSADRLAVAVGPAVRYRRWIGPSKSVEVAIGTPLATTDQNIHAGSVFGLLKWSPNHWFAVAARPELIRGSVFLGCTPIIVGVGNSCTYEVRSRGRVSIGAEAGWVPGVVLTGASGIAILLLIALLSSID